MEEVQGVDRSAVEAWYADHVAGTELPLRFSPIAGGHSNLTYCVTDRAGRRTVLRRPPLGQVLASAHDMGREHHIIAALANTAIPVPPALGYEPDSRINGAPFYVMDFVDGHVLRDLTATEALAPQARTTASDSSIDVLAAIHSVEPADVGLADLGRQEGYVGRQLARWYHQWSESKTRDLTTIDEVHDALAADVPAQDRVSIVHGDYRLDNCIVSDDGTVVAVLDWELCTLGDPLADLGLLMVYWNEPGDETQTLNGPTLAEGMRSRRQVLERYAEVSGRDLGRIDYYTALGYWKLACIVEGVYARYLGGSMGRSDGGVEHFATQVEMLAGAARATLDGRGPTGDLR